MATNLTKDVVTHRSSTPTPNGTSKAAVHFPEDEGFSKSNLRFTEYERPTYLVSISPGCDQDVVEIVKYATDNDVPFSPRSGHHAVTTTMRHLKNGILIDMRSLNKLAFDAEKREVTVGGGVITDDFVKYLQSIGMEVSVIGVAFGAGLGRLQGKYGFLHDNMVSCRLVLADGSVVLVSEETNPDLFWALRGAEHNFGIALEATFRVYPQANAGIHYTWDLEYALDQCDAVFERLNAVSENMPADLAVFVLWIRQSDSGRKNKILSKPEVWSRAPNKMMGAACVEKFDLETTGGFFQSVRAMNEEWAGRGFFGAMFECLPHQRVSRQLPDDATAFPWRWGSNHFLMLMATPVRLRDREAFEGHLDRWKKAFIATSGYGRLQQYVNYGNTTSTMRDPPEALYGYESWRLDKLRALKKVYDPDNVFRWYQPLME
ncbi:FAD-linked oxidoreductase alt4 [Colletotrichum trifolii]|uniref:FAD-linked oxidoreductase alt4 n=1 Tax=Colletotrichum trifolii TaxID=5466 RepID=A0A4R8RSR3_COLTR|nr:FAD-linked oxidoreductase alt4 [Colletotrichum trifolii]